MKGPEVEEFLKVVREHAEKIKSIQNAISGSIVNEPVILEVNKGGNFGVEMTYKVNFKTHEEVFDEASTLIENMFKYRPMEYDGGDEEEPEEDEDEEEGEEEEVDEEDEDEDEDDSFDPLLKDKNVQLGDTNHYCPVTLFTKQILTPGNPEFQCKYREKIYRFINEDNRNLFMEHPEKYLPLKKPPQVKKIFFLLKFKKNCF
jgi:YHS domain-containing protein